MKIFVTGGSGFIGSAVVRKLIANTMHKVINIDILTYAGNQDSLIGLDKNPRYFFEKIDITNRFELDRIFSHYEPDAIMHLAAESHVDRSISAPFDFLHTNIMGTYHLLESTRLYLNKLSDIEKQESFRFHHISTDEVFGDLGANMSPFTEQSNYNPSSP